jgi:hypothetical protein
MFGNNDIRSHIGHVTLGLFCKLIIDELIDIRKAGTKKISLERELVGIPTMIDSLIEIANPGSIERPRYEELMFLKIQEADTLREVFEKEYNVQRNINKEGYKKEAGKWIGVFEQITNPKLPYAKKQKYFEEALSFITSLEKKAINNTNTPIDNSPPPGIGECYAANLKGRKS